MSVTVNQVTTVEVPLDGPLAIVGGDGGTLYLWPGGVGAGPMVGMSVRDWEQIKRSADEAIRVQRMKLERYTACEGNNGGDDK